MLAVLMTTQSGQGIVKITHRPGRPFLFMARHRDNSRTHAQGSTAIAAWLWASGRRLRSRSSSSGVKATTDNRAMTGSKPVAVAELQPPRCHSRSFVPCGTPRLSSGADTRPRWLHRSVSGAVHRHTLVNKDPFQRLGPQPGDRSRPQRTTHTCKGTPRSSPARGRARRQQRDQRPGYPQPHRSGRLTGAWPGLPGCSRAVADSDRAQSCKLRPAAFPPVYPGFPAQ